MQRLPRPLLLLHPDRAFRDRLRPVVSAPHVLRPIPGWDALRAALRTAPPGSVAVVDPYAEGDGELCTALRDILRDFRSATVVAAHRFEPVHYGDLRTLGQWGIAELICIGREDTRAALGRRLRAVQARPIERVLRPSLSRAFSGRARTLLTAAAETVVRGGQAPELAAALELKERTLLRWCERADLPPPRRLLAWIRVLLACDLLDDPGHTLSSAARSCGYAADMPLRRAIRNLVGEEPQALREEGALSVASRAFTRELHALREQGRESRRAAPRERRICVV